MKKTFGIICAVIAIFVAGAILGNRYEKKHFKVENTTIKDIMARCSVRAFTDEAVSDEQTETLLRAAMAAPSARNQQPWKFVVVKNRETLDYIAENFHSMKMASTAQLAILVCGDMELAIEGEGRDYWVQDCSAATENLLVAVQALGLGACWCGIHPISERVAQMRGLFQLPSHIMPMGIMIIGHPSPEADLTPKDKWKPENIRYEKWS